MSDPIHFQWPQTTSGTQCNYRFKVLSSFKELKITIFYK